MNGQRLKDKPPMITAQDERELVSLARDGDLSARNRLIKAHMGLIFNTAKEVNRPAHIALEDLVNEAVVVMCKILVRPDLFDQSAGVRLMTYCGTSIQRAMWRHIYASNLIKVGETSKRFSEATREEKARWRAESYSQLPVDVLGKVREVPGCFTGFEEIDDADEIRYRSRLVYEAMKELTPGQSAAIRMRFEEKGVKQIAKHFGITKQGVSFRYMKGMEKLKEILAESDYEF